MLCLCVVGLDYSWRWQVQVSVYCARRIPVLLRCIQCSILLHIIDTCFLTCSCLWQTFFAVVVRPGLVVVVFPLQPPSSANPGCLCPESSVLVSSRLACPISSQVTEHWGEPCNRAGKVHPVDPFHSLDNLKNHFDSIAFCRNSAVYKVQNGAVIELSYYHIPNLISLQMNITINPIPPSYQLQGKQPGTEIVRIGKLSKIRLPTNCQKDLAYHRVPTVMESHGKKAVMESHGN